MEFLEHHVGGPSNKLYCLNELFQSEKTATSEVLQRPLAIAGVSAGSSSSSTLGIAQAHGEAQGSTASLDEAGFALVMSTGSQAELSLFIRRLVDWLGGDVSREAGLESFTLECLNSSKLRSLDAVVERITSAECSWIASTTVRM